MNARENLLALLRREPYEWVPVQFDLCPALEKTYHAVTGSTIPYADYFAMPWRNIGDIRVHTNPEQYLPYHAHLKPGASIDLWGVAHEPGSDAAMHMTYMRSPLRGITDPDTVRAYPLPDFADGDASHQTAEVESIHARGLAAMGNMQCTVWETAWYMRGMEDLMMDMLSDDPIASYLLDAVTDRAAIRAASYARAGADLLFLGDDIGMQRTPMMSTDLYCTWLKPRLKRVIDAARAVKPDIIVCYHSCGYITPFIPHLIDAGIDVLNPIQPESMEFPQLYRTYGGHISFHGTIGTQSVMPFGTPEQVRENVWQHLNLSDRGGLFPAPTHLLEPEVPFENILAYVDACRTWRKKS